MDCQRCHRRVDDATAEAEGWDAVDAQVPHLVFCPDCLGRLTDVEWDVIRDRDRQDRRAVHQEWRRW
jgi:hypothetical protein